MVADPADRGRFARLLPPLHVWILAGLLLAAAVVRLELLGCGGTLIRCGEVAREGARGGWRDVT